MFICRIYLKENKMALQICTADLKHWMFCIAGGVMSPQFTSWKKINFVFDSDFCIKCIICTFFNSPIIKCHFKTIYKSIKRSGELFISESLQCKLNNFEL